MGEGGAARAALFGVGGGRSSHEPPCLLLQPALSWLGAGLQERTGRVQHRCGQPTHAQHMLPLIAQQAATKLAAPTMLLHRHSRKHTAHLPAWMWFLQAPDKPPAAVTGRRLAAQLSPATAGWVSLAGPAGLAGATAEPEVQWT